MSRLFLFSAMAACVALAGCTSSYQASSPALDLGKIGMAPVKSVELETGGTPRETGGLDETDEEVARILKRNAPMKVPGRLAMAELEWVYHGEGSIPTRPLTMNPRTRKALRVSLEKTKYFSSVSFLLPALLSYQGGVDIPGLRKAAASVNADFLLLLIRESDQDRYSNAMALTYLAILPAGFMPGTHYKVRVKETGLLINVRNGRIFCSVGAESRRNWMGPLWWLNESSLQQDARTAAVETLADELVRQLADVKKTDNKDK